MSVRTIEPPRGGFNLEPILKEAWSQDYPETAICVQRFDDSLSSAIRITYRISLRSSSLREPRYPLLRVVFGYVIFAVSDRKWVWWYEKGVNKYKYPPPPKRRLIQGDARNISITITHLRINFSALKWYGIVHRGLIRIRNNDPSAGSPTETLLRLLLPLNDQVWSPSRMLTEVSNGVQQSRELTKPFNR